MINAGLYEQPCLRQITGPTIRPGGLLLTERLTAHGRIPAGATVLDVGCGCGETVRYLRNQHGLDALGIDRSRLLLNEGLQRHPGLPIMCAEASDLPFAPGAFDAVFCECVFSLLADARRTLFECGRVLKSAGLLLISDLYARIPDEPAGCLDAAYACCLKGTASRGSIEQGIRAAGFSILLWEDHSRLLKELAAQIVFRHGSLLSFWRNAVGERDASRLCANIGSNRPGYYLLVARKDTP